MSYSHISYILITLYPSFSLAKKTKAVHPDAPAMPSTAQPHLPCYPPLCAWRPPPTPKGPASSCASGHTCNGPHFPQFGKQKTTNSQPTFSVKAGDSNFFEIQNFEISWSVCKKSEKKNQPPPPPPEKKKKNSRKSSGPNKNKNSRRTRTPKSSVGRSLLRCLSASGSSWGFYWRIGDLPKSYVKMIGIDRIGFGRIYVTYIKSYESRRSTICANDRCLQPPFDLGHHL